MNRNRPTFPTSTTGVEVVETDDGSRTLRFIGKPVSWHSESGALAESQLVYLENSGVAEQLLAGRTTNVFEVGFGTGLNFWLTASEAMKLQATLNYTAVEPNLITTETLVQLKYDQLASCSRALNCFAKSIFEDSNREILRNFTADSISIRLFGSTLQQWLKENHESFDAIFFDPFDPDEAPDLWETDVLEQLFRRTKPAGRLVTYCVKSRIQKAFTRVGYEVRTTRGPAGGKREVLIAERLQI